MSMSLKVSRIVDKKEEEEIKADAKERKAQSDSILETVYDRLLRSFKSKERK